MKVHSILPGVILAIGSAIIGAAAAGSINQPLPEGLAFSSIFAANVVLVIRLIAEPKLQTEAM